MKKNLKKALPVLCGALVVLSNTAFADMSESHLVAQNKEMTKKQKMDKNQQPSGMADRWDLFVFGDAILTQADQDNMSLGSLNNAPPDLSVPNLADTDASVVNMHFKYDWSFRVGIGGTPNYDHWKPVLAWTHLRNTASTHQNTTDEQSLIPNSWLAIQALPGVSKTFGDVDTARGKWHVAAEILDLVVGREYAATKWLQMTPYLGLRSAFIFQEFDVIYSGGITLPGLTEFNTMKSRFWGIGPELGLALDFGLGYGFSIDGGVSLSAVHGFFTTKRFEQSFADDIFVQTMVNLKNGFRATRAMLDLWIGAQWKQSFANERYELGFRLGYEQHVFYQQNVFITGSGYGTNTPGTHSGDLGFQGFSFGGMVGF